MPASGVAVAGHFPRLAAGGNPGNSAAGGAGAGEGA